MATTNSSDGRGHLRFIDEIALEDAAGLKKAHESYGASWKKRGGIGAYMVMIRKFDRMEMCVKKYGGDIFKAVQDDPRAEGILDDIRDARRYLMLIESVLRERGIVEAGNHRDNLPEGGVPRSYSDLDNPDAHLVGAKAPEAVIGRREQKMRVIAKALELNDQLGLKYTNHIPDGACRCFRCLAMKEISATLHIKDCECENCYKAKLKITARAEARKRMDALLEKEGRYRAIWIDGEWAEAEQEIRDSIEKVAEAVKGKTLHLKGQPINKDSSIYARLEAQRQADHRVICSGCDDPAHYRGETSAEVTGIVQDQLKAEAAERALRTDR